MISVGIADGSFTAASLRLRKAGVFRIEFS